MKLRRLREGDVLDDGITLVGGGELEPEVLRADAMRYRSGYGIYGISVFAARSATVEELAQQVPLVGPVRHTDAYHGRSGALGGAAAGADRAQPAPLHRGLR
jgi:hypothetical protein